MTFQLKNSGAALGIESTGRANCWGVIFFSFILLVKFDVFACQLLHKFSNLLRWGFQNIDSLLVKLRLDYLAAMFRVVVLLHIFQINCFKGCPCTSGSHSDAVKQPQTMIEASPCLTIFFVVVHIVFHHFQRH